MTSLPSDSHGTPWQGRSFEGSPASTDDGSAPPHLAAALQLFGAGGGDVVDVVEAIRVSRLLVPLVAELVEAGEGPGGQRVDKSADLGIVTVAGPDGRRVLPVFSSVTAMTAWREDARPVPSDAVKVALAAVSENVDLVVLDPGSRTEFVIRRPAVWALAQGHAWVPSFLDDAVLTAFLGAAEPETSIAAILLDCGDPTARLAGPELAVTVAVHPGLARADLDALLHRLSIRVGEDEVISARVDSLGMRVVGTADIDGSASPR